MRLFVASVVSLLAVFPYAACSSSGPLPDGACTPSDPSCVGGGPDAGRDAAPAADAKAGAAEASCFTVDDAGLTHGCSAGGMGPGDRDDGGGAPPPPPPNVARDAGDLSLGSPCWDNAQCDSGMCFDYAVKGTYCTEPCPTDASCPLPFMGCNGMGVCRIDTGQ